MSRERPTIVTAIAALFLLSAVYLLIVGLTMLARPGFLSMAAGADLLSGLETAGPYMFLLVSAAGISVGVGLLRLQNWARRIANSFSALMASDFFGADLRGRSNAATLPAERVRARTRLKGVVVSAARVMEISDPGSTCLSGGRRLHMTLAGH